MLANRDPEFYNRLKQMNEELLKLVELNMKNAPYYDFSPTFQDYTDKMQELIKRFPELPAGLEPSSEQEPNIEGSSEQGEDAPPPEPNIETFDEPDAKFQTRCKLYLRCADNGPNSVLKGCGSMFVKELDTPDRLQIIVRQDPDLKKILLNHVITREIPIKLLPRLVQIFIPSSDGRINCYMAKVRDDSQAKQLFEVLNSIKR